MIVKTIQNRKVLDTLLSNKIHFSKRDKIDNLTEPYKKMSEYYNWGSSPIFCCEVGRYSNFYGANCEDAVLLTLDVPDDLVKRQIYYDWSDVVYYTEFPNEWEYGSFDKYIWSFVNNKVQYIDYEITSNELSDKISNDLKRRGMTFVGTTIIYSYLQAIGIINSHHKDCYKGVK